MAEYFIKGGKPLRGSLTVHGAKNAVLPILAASILAGDVCEISNCPKISDVRVMQNILQELGCNVDVSGDCITVDSKNITSVQVSEQLMKQMRSSVFLVGPLLVRCGKAIISQPGGCCIGKRPIDIHIKALEKLGAVVHRKGEQLVFEGRHLKGANVILSYPSVGATENIMMAALEAFGQTTIYNCAKEPEIVDLQNFLVACGAKIQGAGTSRIIIQGKQKLRGTHHCVIGDRIEAGTYLMAAAVTGGELEINGASKQCLKSCIKLLKFAGCKVQSDGEMVYLKAPERLYSAGHVKTGTYPGFPTDLQPQFTAIMATALGKTKMEETVFEKRYGYTEELIKMGADIEIFNRIAIINGKELLEGNRVCAQDLRGGAALVLAGLHATGSTVVENIEFIERGYCNFHKELRKLGAEIDRCI